MSCVFSLATATTLTWVLGRSSWTFFKLNKEDLDPEVLLTIARVDRIVAKANEIKKERARVRDLAERILEAEIDCP